MFFVECTVTATECLIRGFVGGEHHEELVNELDACRLG